MTRTSTSWVRGRNLRHLLLGRKAMTNLHSVLKSRDKETFSDKGPYTQNWFFPVVMYGCESWTIKEAKCWKINAPELWFWRRVLWTARRSNQSILKEINTKYSVERLMLKLQYFGHKMQRVDSLEKNPDAGKDWGQEEKGATEDEMARKHHQLNGHEFEQTLDDSKGQGKLGSYIAHGIARSQTQISVWTTIFD